MSCGSTTTRDVFPARDVSTDPRSGEVRRQHVDPAVVNKAIKVAARRVGMTKVISAHSFRHGTCPRTRAAERCGGITWTRRW